METNVFRSKSIARLAKGGISIPSALPLLDEFSLRPAAEILDRLTCLNGVAAVAHGFDREKAFAWVSEEGMLDNLTQDERSLLLTGAGDLDAFKVQVEGMWALAWVANIVPGLDFCEGAIPDSRLCCQTSKKGRAVPTSAHVHDYEPRRKLGASATWPIACIGRFGRPRSRAIGRPRRHSICCRRAPEGS